MKDGPAVLVQAIVQCPKESLVFPAWLLMITMVSLQNTKQAPALTAALWAPGIRDVVSDLMQPDDDELVICALGAGHIAEVDAGLPESILPIVSATVRYIEARAPDSCAKQCRCSDSVRPHFEATGKPLPHPRWARNRRRW